MLHPLTTFRKAKNVTLKALALAADTSRQTVWRIENGQQEASLAMLRRLSAATEGEVSVSQLIEAMPDPARTEALA